MYLGLAECDKAYSEWQDQADDVDRLLETRETELKSVEVPSGDVEERERQKQILDVRKIFFLCMCFKEGMSDGKFTTNSNINIQFGIFALLKTTK